MLVYVISMVFIGLNITIILGFGFFTYSDESTSSEHNIKCYAVRTSMVPLPANASSTEIAKAVDVSERFDLIFAIGFWVYIFAWFCYLCKLLVNYLLAKDILFFKIILSLLLFLGFVHFVFATIWRFDHAGRVCSNPDLAITLASIHVFQSNTTNSTYLENEGKFLGETIKFQWALIVMIIILLVVYKLQDKRQKRKDEDERRRIFGESVVQTSSDYTSSFAHNM